MVGRFYVKTGGAWVEPTNLYVKTGGAWVGALEGWVKAAGTWQQFYPQPATGVLMLDLNFLTMAPTLDSKITFTRSTTATYYNSSGVLSSAAINAPRFDYDPVTHAAKGLLIEEARTNFQIFSQDFSSSWLPTGLTVTVNTAVAPDGTTTADKLTASATTASIDLGNGGFANAVTYTTTVFAKKDTSDWFYICGLITGTGAQTPRAYFNLATGMAGTKDALITTATIQSIGNGWYRCSATTVGTAGNERSSFGICNADASPTVTVGKSIFLWGAQAETGAFATSYVPTPSSSTVARAADVATMTGTNFSSWYNTSAGTFVAEFDVLAVSGTRGILAADNNATAEMIRLYGSGTDPKVTITDNSTTQADLDAGTITANATHKLGVSYAANDIAACLNGGTVGTDTAATMPTPTQLRIGTESATAANILNGHVRRIQFWNGALSDAALQAATVLGDTSLVLDLDFTTGTLDSKVTFTRTTTATYVNSSGLIAAVAIDAARFDYDPATLSARGLLIEEQRTNILLRSDNLAAGEWGSYFPTGTLVRTPFAAAAPDGATAATLIEMNRSGSGDWGQAGAQSFTGTAASYTASIWLKARNAGMVGRIVCVSMYNGSAPVGLVNVALTANWVRTTLTGTLVAGGCQFFYGFIPLAGGSTETGQTDFYVWGAQLELGAFATSFIYTNTAAVTRAADRASMTGTNFSSWYNQPEGTFVMNYRPKSVTQTQEVLYVQDNSFNDILHIIIAGSDQRPKGEIYSGGSLQQTTFDHLQIITVGALVKQAKAYKVNDFADCVNGGVVDLDTAGSVSVAPNQTWLGGFSLGSSPYSGHIEKLQFYNVRKSNAELQALTT